MNLNKRNITNLYIKHISEIKKRYNTALENAKFENLIIFSGKPLPVFLDDVDYPFKVNPYFTNWLPLRNSPCCYLIYSPNIKPILIFFQAKDFWHKTSEKPEEFLNDLFDIRIIDDFSDIKNNLPNINKDRTAIIGDFREQNLNLDIKNINPKKLINFLDYQRKIKTQYEIECIKIASEIAFKGHKIAESSFKQKKSEFEIHLDYCKATKQIENELPYGNIIALNEHAAILHYQDQSPIVPNESKSLLIDAGAKYNGLACDITRTYSATEGEFSDLVQEFEKLQLELISYIGPEINFIDLHMQCHYKIAQLLNKVGLAKGTPEALINTEVTSTFFPHGLGHFLGLQVHDVGGFLKDSQGSKILPPKNHPFLRLTQSLEINQVLTIEPGIYVIDMLIEKLRNKPGFKLLNQKKIQWLKPYGGIRIEDNIRILKDGVENLTRDAFS